MSPSLSGDPLIHYSMLVNRVDLLNFKGTYSLNRQGIVNFVNNIIIITNLCLRVTETEQEERELKVKARMGTLILPGGQVME